MDISITRSNKAWATIGIKAYVMLMLQFLRFSPSYDLANTIHKEQLSEEEWQKRLIDLYEREKVNGKLAVLSEEQKRGVIEDFQQVLKTYEEYGDINALDFKDWWLEKGLPIYGVDYNKPIVKEIAYVEKEVKFDQSIIEAIKQYSIIRSGQGHPPVLLVSIPLGVNKKQTMAQISKLIDEKKVPIVPKTKKPKKELAAQRLRSKALFKAIQILMFKARLPNLVLWRLGVYAEISPINAIGLDPKKELTTKLVDQANRMTILTSRALRRARLISENAAHGQFPSSQVRLLPYFDYKGVNKRAAMRSKNPKVSQYKKRK
jgi:hypothetical protein